MSIQLRGRAERGDRKCNFNASRDRSENRAAVDALALREKERDKIGHRCTGLAAPRVWDLNPMQAEQPGPHKGSFHGAVGPGAFWGLGCRDKPPPSLPPSQPPIQTLVILVPPLCGSFPL